MECLVCDWITHFKNDGIYTHCGNGKTAGNLTIGQKYTANEIFNEIDKSKIYNGGNGKPTNCIWFSQGSWQIDSYHDGFNCEDHKTNDYKTLCIQKPKNILKIDTIDKLHQFQKEYNLEQEPPFFNGIDWKKLIGKNEYYGVEFPFCKVSDIDPDHDYFSEFFWHCGFDVESLIIWDLRSIDYIVPTQWGALHAPITPPA